MPVTLRRTSRSASAVPEAHGPGPRWTPERHSAVPGTRLVVHLVVAGLAGHRGERGPGRLVDRPGAGEATLVLEATGRRLGALAVRPADRPRRTSRAGAAGAAARAPCRPCRPCSAPPGPPLTSRAWPEQRASRCCVGSGWSVASAGVAALVAALVDVAGGGALVGAAEPAGSRPPQPASANAPTASPTSQAGRVRGMLNATASRPCRRTGSSAPSQGHRSSAAPPRHPWPAGLARVLPAVPGITAP